MFLLRHRFFIIYLPYKTKILQIMAELKNITDFRSVGNNTQVYGVDIKVCPSSSKLFSGEKVYSRQIRLFDASLFFGRDCILQKSYANNRWSRPWHYEKWHFFDTEQEALEYIEKFKMEHYDTLRRILTQRKRRALENLKSINDRIALLR